MIIVAVQNSARRSKCQGLRVQSMIVCQYSVRFMYVQMYMYNILCVSIRLCSGIHISVCSSQDELGVQKNVHVYNTHKRAILYVL